MKKLTLMLLATVSAAMLMTGCGKEESKKSGESIKNAIEQKTDEANKNLGKAGDDAGREIKKTTGQVDEDLKNLGSKLKK